MKPGKNQEGYWIADHLLEQIKYKAIPIFETLYPNYISVFAFNNSSNHAAFGKDTLVASQMNLNSGGKQPIMHDTYFRPNQQPQSIVILVTYHNEKLVN